MTQTNTSPKRKRKMSASARRRIAEAQRKRWSDYHASKASTNGDGDTVTVKAVSELDRLFEALRNIGNQLYLHGRETAFAEAVKILQGKEK